MNEEQKKDENPVKEFCYDDLKEGDWVPDSYESKIFLEYDKWESDNPISAKLRDISFTILLAGIALSLLYVFVSQPLILIVILVLYGIWRNFRSLRLKIKGLRDMTEKDVLDSMSFIEWRARWDIRDEIRKKNIATEDFRAYSIFSDIMSSLYEDGFVEMRRKKSSLEGPHKGKPIHVYRKKAGGRRVKKENKEGWVVPVESTA